MVRYFISITFSYPLFPQRDSYNPLLYPHAPETISYPWRGKKRRTRISYPYDSGDHDDDAPHECFDPLEVMLSNTIGP